jgi:hypothetical protein
MLEFRQINFTQKPSGGPGHKPEKGLCEEEALLRDMLLIRDSVIHKVSERIRGTKKNFGACGGGSGNRL